MKNNPKEKNKLVKVSMKEAFEKINPKKVKSSTVNAETIVNNATGL